VKKDDRQKFLEVVIGMAELKGKVYSGPALELYWNSMQDWGIEDFVAAAALLIRRCEFMPTPKDFEDLRRAGRATAAEAWAAVLQSVRSGDYRAGLSVPDHRVTAAVAAIGGWRSIAMSEESKLHFMEHRFTEVYEQQQDVSEVRCAVPQIADFSAKLLAFKVPRDAGSH
jgi:hypothetical protein